MRASTLSLWSRTWIPDWILIHVRNILPNWHQRIKTDWTGPDRKKLRNFRIGLDQEQIFWELGSIKFENLRPIRTDRSVDPCFQMLLWFYLPTGPWPHYLASCREVRDGSTGPWTVFRFFRYSSNYRTGQLWLMENCPPSPDLVHISLIVSKKPTRKIFLLSISRVGSKKK